MGEAMSRLFKSADVAIMAAAVADFTFDAAANKLKKRDGSPDPTWIESKDIVAQLVSEKTENQLVVGFAAETQDVLTNAQAKLKAKSLDLLVVNDVSDETIGFDGAHNAVTLLSLGEPPTTIARGTKDAIALEVLTRVDLLLLKEKK
jgi:phosphopantothenoylcysteine decarboxylase/phosphopantothenate--cysteine ligase